MNKITCFVIMPFGSRTRDPNKYELWTELYFDHIKPTVEAFDRRISCVRADEILRSGSIIGDVVDQIARSQLAIVEMTDQNPNVFYELGVRHALSSSTILLAQSASDIPFDLQDSRAIIYKFTPRGVEKLKETLHNYVRNILDDPFRPDNPVQAYLVRSPLSPLSKPSREGVAEEERVALLSELVEIKKQNRGLSQLVQELRTAITGSISLVFPVSTPDLSGTWTDVAFGNETKYARHVDSHLIIAYRGRWPGVMWGRVDNDVYRFAWSRFSEELAGKGYLKVAESETVLHGGIWFDDRDLDDHDLARAEGENRLGWIEEHHLMKNSISVDETGRAVIKEALVWLRQRSLLR